MINTKQALFFVTPLLLAATVFSQVIPPSRRPVLEEYGDPPGEIGMQRNTPGMVMHYGPYTITQVNVNGSGLNISGDAANEPSIAVDPTNPNRMSIGWRQFNTVTSNFRQGGWAYTTDAGAHWTFPGVLQNNTFRSDPVLLADSTGKFMYLSLLTTFYDDTWTSTNGGATYTRTGVTTTVTTGATSATQTVASTAGMNPGMVLYFWNANTTRTVSSVTNATTVVLTTSVTSATGEAVTTSAEGADKEWFTIDNGASTGHGFLYQNCSTSGNNYGGRQFNRSIDGGKTWSAPIFFPNPQPIWGVPDLATNGDLYISGTDTGSNYYCMKSTNAKNSGVTPTFSIVNVNLGGAIVFSGGINPAGLAGQVWLAVDRSSGPTAGYVYMLCSCQQPGTNGTDVMFARSTNGGASFSSPIKINDDSGNINAWHWMGALSVAPNGRIDVTWLDTRQDPGNLFSALYYSYSLDGGLTWAPNIQASPTFNPSLGYPNQNKMGDYMTSVSDSTGAALAFCATFNGEEDVYYTHVSPLPITVQPTDISYVVGTPVSGDLSSILQSDDVDFIGKAAPVGALSQPPVQIAIGCTSPSKTPQGLTFKLESNSNSTSILQKILLYNVQTSSYEELDSRNCTTTDQIVTVTPTGDLSRFVDQTSKRIVALETYRPVMPLGFWPWLARIDQAQFTVTPGGP